MVASGWTRLRPFSSDQWFSALNSCVTYLSFDSINYWSLRLSIWYKHLNEEKFILGTVHRGSECMIEGPVPVCNGESMRVFDD